MDSATGDTAQPDGAVCEPCDQTFTTKRAYVRHMRENKRHRTDDEGSERSFKCRLCVTTCARQYDLRRHQLEQHPNGTLVCEACGTQYRPGNHSEDECAMWTRAQETAVSIVEIAALAVNRSEIRRSTVLSFERQILEATDSLLTTNPTPSDHREDVGPTTAWPVPPGQRHAAILDIDDTSNNHKRPVCGHCHKKFERTQTDVVQHLGRHKKELDLSHECLKCDISFVREQDLIHHQQNAKTGDCGFQFEHVNSCNGHHPAFCVDREAFCDRVRSWEQSQLQLFGRSVAAYLSYCRVSKKRDLPESKSCRGDFNYHTRMGKMTADFSNVRISKRFHEHQEIHQYSAARLSQRPPSTTQPHARASAARSLRRAQLLQPDRNGSRPFPSTFSHTQPLDQASMSIIRKPRNHFDRRRSKNWTISSSNEIISVGEFASKLLGASRNAHGETLLHEFARNNNASAISLLLDAGVFVDDENGHRRTALHTACLHGSHSAADELIRYRALLDATDLTGRTPLHYASMVKSYPLADSLLLAGADANRRDNDDLTPLHYAIRGESLEIVHVLVSNGADIHLTDRHGNTPLHDAVRDGWLNLVDFLLANGAHANLSNHYGDTALHAAVLSGSFTMTRALHLNGADSRLKNNKGLTPLGLSQKLNYSDPGLEELLSCGAHVGGNGLHA